MVGDVGQLVAAFFVLQKSRGLLAGLLTADGVGRDRQCERHTPKGQEEFLHFL